MEVENDFYYITSYKYKMRINALLIIWVKNGRDF